MPAEKIFRVAVLLLLIAALAAPPSAAQSRAARGAAAPAGAALPTVKPRIVSETVKHDSDDPAIWIDRSNPARSLVLGTDKDADGAL